MSALDLIKDPVFRADCEERAWRIYQAAYKRQGVRGLESTRHAAALHEAGHAVAYAATADGMRWWPPYRVRIWKEPVPGLSVWLGVTAVSPQAPPLRITPDDLPATLIHAIRVAAGVVSEMQFDGHDYRAASSVDELLLLGGLARNLEAWQWPAPAEQCMSLLMAVTARILKANAETVRAVAGVLERQRKIQGRELSRMLQGVRPIQIPPCFSELARWTP